MLSVLWLSNSSFVEKSVLGLYKSNKTESPCSGSARADINPLHVHRPLLALIGMLTRTQPPRWLCFGSCSVLLRDRGETAWLLLREIYITNSHMITIQNQNVRLMKNESKQPRLKQVKRRRRVC